MQVRRVLLSQLEPPEITTVRTLYIYIYIYIYIYCIISTQNLLYRICSCPRTHSHLEPLCMHTYSQVFTSIHKYSPVFTSIHVSYYRSSCVSTQVVRTHICLCPCECSHFDYFCIHQYIQKCTYIIS